MQTLNRQELLELLSNVNGTTFVSLETRVNPRLKSGNPFVNLEKVSKVCGAIGFNYQNSVNNQRLREDLKNDFKSEPRKWGQRVSGTPLVRHNNKLYLEIKVQSSESDFFDKNQRINIDKIKPWEYTSTSRQGLEKDVILRDYSIDNISRITINKKEYRIC